MVIDDTVSASVYAGRITRTLNEAFVALMISIGHRTGLFDVMAALPPSTSLDIAIAAGLAERYVREWLAAMTAARIVEHDARTRSYFLPIEYAAVLTRAAGSNNLAPAAELVSILGNVEDMVVAGFRSGGGVHGEAYERLREVTSLEARKLVDESYVEEILTLIPEMRERLVAGATVLDVGCGEGIVTNLMARMFPRANFRGYDLSPWAIVRAREHAAEAELKNVEFDVGDVASLDEPRSYDLVLSLDSMHEQGFARLVLRNIATALRRGGVFLMQEVSASSELARNLDLPYAPMLYAVSTLHSVPLALSQDGEALGRMWGEARAWQLLHEAGFANLRFERLEAAPQSVWCVASR